MTDRSAEPGAQPALPDDPEQLRQEIERTREQLGETVEALMAKTDVKARAKERANQLSERLKGTTAQVKEQAAARAEQARSQLAGKTADAKNAAVQTSGTTRNQLQARATAVGGAVRDKTPEPVQRAAQQVTQRASAVGARRLGLVAAAAAGAAVAGIIVIQWRRRR
jgi:septal ring factor EnvC (AmiA/AmiB activator)